MSRSYRLAPKLEDCQDHGVGAELLIVEGDSAADVVLQVRDRRWQAVLPMQGKPMNTVAASPKKVGSNVQFAALIDAIGCGWGETCDVATIRYERIVLLLDPDADGIHSRILLLLFFHTWMRQLLDNGRIYAALPPLWEISSPRLAEPVHVFTRLQYDDVISQLEAQGESNPSVERYRGVASIPPEKLTSWCLDPATRTVSPQTSAQAEAALASLDRMKTMAASPPPEA